ncbi:MAG: heme biosynthesis HemY N-terminal domain-containing protein [Spongiibacteraceae bacterium]
MKRLFLAVLATLLVAAALAAAISNDSGYVLIAFGNYTLETTVWIGLLLVLVILVLMYVLAMLLHRGKRYGSAWSRWQQDRSSHRGRRQTLKGLMAFHEGQYARARHLLDRSAEASDQPLLNHLMAARASSALGDREQTQLYLHRAERSGSRHLLAFSLTQAELLLAQEQYDDAWETLQRVRKQARRNPVLLRLLKDTCVARQDWSELLRVLPDLRRYRVLAEGEIETLETRAAVNLLGTRENASADTLRTRWAQLPKSAQRQPGAIAAYAQALFTVGAADNAEQLLRAFMKRDWNETLADLYGRIDSSDPARQLATAESWLSEHPHDATLLRALGRLSLRNQLWGKARDYFDTSLRIDNHPETCAELGRLLAHLGQHERSADYFERGLLSSAGGLPALPMPTKIQNA